jgi:transcriptional regulator with XRE-family HTH domain
MYDVITAVPTSEQMTEVRQRTGLTQTELGKIIGINLRNYQLRETGDRTTNPGEYNLLMLLADNHPLYRIKGYTPEKDAAGIAEKLLLAEPDAAEVKRLRIAMGLKQQEVADRFGYTPGARKSKEMASKRGTLRQAEYNFMLLLLGEHPTLKLTARKTSQAN